jgi:ATP-dependent Clp protease ATP-binding subunit ClpC
MYDRFTDRSRRVMQIANREAQRFGHEFIATEHILLGLVEEGTGVAATALKNLGIGERKLRREIAQVFPARSDAPVSDRSLPLTPRAKKVMEYAVEEARGLRHNDPGTEHILLGSLREQEGVAAQVLTNLGLTLDAVRAEILNLLGRSTDEPVVVPTGASARESPAGPALPPEVRELVDDLTRSIETTAGEKEQAVAECDPDRAGALRERQANLIRTRDAVLREWQSGQ